MSSLHIVAVLRPFIASLFNLFHLHSLFRISILIICSTLGVTAPVFGQNIQYTQGATDLILRSDLEVDPTTLGLNLQVTLGEYQGRGINLPIDLRYSSKVWRIEFLDYFVTAAPRTRTEGKFAEASKSGWTTSLGVPWFGGGVNYQGPYDASGNPICMSGGCFPPEPFSDFYINRLLLHMPDGSAHELRKDDGHYSCCLTTSGVYLAVDGSQIRYDSSAGTLYLPDGSRYLLNLSGGAQAQYIDRNGNRLTYTYSTRQWTDTLGRSFSPPPMQNTASADVTYSLPGAGTESKVYTFRWRYLHEIIPPYTFPGAVRPIGDRDYTEANAPEHHDVPSLFNSNFPYEYIVSNGPPFTPTQAGYHDPVVLYQIVLPNGRAYTFDYNVYGEITRATYPTGSYEEFTYARLPGFHSSMTSSAYNQANRGVISRKISARGDGSDVVEWTYSVTNTDGHAIKTIAPNGDYTERRIYVGRGADVRFGFDDVRLGRAYDERAYSASGQLLRRTLTRWEMTGSGVGTLPTRNPRVAKVVEILLDTGGNALTKTTTMEYDADLNVNKISHYGYTTVPQTTATSNPADLHATTINSFIDSFPIGSLMKTEERTHLVNDPNIPQATRDAYRARNLLALPTQTLIKDGAGNTMALTKYSYDESAYAPLTYSGTVPGWTDPGTFARGNLTTTQGWKNFNDTYITTHAQPDQCGNIRKTWDANGNVSEIFYDDAFSDNISRNTFAFATRTESPIPDPSGDHGSAQELMTYTTYDFQTGNVTRTRDANDKETLYTYYPANLFNRLQTIAHPDGGETSYEYSDTPGNLFIRTRVRQDTQSWLDDYVLFDGLGRAWRSGHYESPGSWIVRDTQYDALGRVWRVSNPYQAGNLNGAINPPGLWTTTDYDALSRVARVTTPDGAHADTAYSGNQVTVTDQAGKTRRSETDALGRLIKIIEDPGGLNYETTYLYDALDNLRKVTQGTQTRYFAYNALSRLIRARNPEQSANSSLPAHTDRVTGNSQWSTAYVYDDNGNLTQKTDARGVISTYSYDALNRNGATDYTNGSQINHVRRAYDVAVNGKGRLASEYTQTGSTNVSRDSIESYDAMGRPLVKRQEFWRGSGWGDPYVVQQTYDRAGNARTQTYPSGRTVSYGYDTAGRLNNFTGNLGGGSTVNYATDIQYNGSGLVSRETYGTQTPLYLKLHYNRRMQLADLRLSSVDNEWDLNRGCMTFFYGPNGVASDDPFANNTDNNGNLWHAFHYVPSDDAVSSFSVPMRHDYSYDQLNRIKSVRERQRNQSGVWTESVSQVFNYDRWGNRTIGLPGGGSGGSRRVEAGRLAMMRRAT